MAPFLWHWPGIQVCTVMRHSANIRKCHLAGDPAKFHISIPTVTTYQWWDLWTKSPLTVIAPHEEKLDKQFGAVTPRKSLCNGWDVSTPWWTRLTWRDAKDTWGPGWESALNKTMTVFWGLQGGNNWRKRCLLWTVLATKGMKLK
jgi:hypothetical protein